MKTTLTEHYAHSGKYKIRTQLSKRKWNRSKLILKISSNPTEMNFLSKSIVWDKKTNLSEEWFRKLKSLHTPKWQRRKSSINKITRTLLTVKVWEVPIDFATPSKKSTAISTRMMVVPLVSISAIVRHQLSRATLQVKMMRNLETLWCCRFVFFYKRLMPLRKSFRRLAREKRGS